MHYHHSHLFDIGQLKTELISVKKMEEEVGDGRIKSSVHITFF
jgi:ribosomal protein S24E